MPETWGHDGCDLSTAPADPSWKVELKRLRENAAAFAALPPEEQTAAYEAERCAECGCHPDEHGDR